jgi:hypothetical protein
MVQGLCNPLLLDEASQMNLPQAAMAALATVVARRPGFDEDEALTLGRAGDAARADRQEYPGSAPVLSVRGNLLA